MKRVLFGVIVCAFVVTFAPLVWAETQAPAAQNTQKPDAAALSKRLEERKTRLQTRLDNNQSRRLSAACGGAQTKLGIFSARFKNSDTPYRTKYDNYLLRLEKLQTRLKQNNVDTTKLDQEIVALKEKIKTLKAAVDQFVQSVDDAKAVDCKNDPAAFRAALDDAKSQAMALKAARADLEKYARETTKATIEELKSQRKSNQEQR